MTKGNEIHDAAFDYIVSMTIFLRFVFGLILAGGLAMWWQLPLVAIILFPLTIGMIAAIWGDKFILGFMSFMRFFR